VLGQDGADAATLEDSLVERHERPARDAKNVFDPFGLQVAQQEMDGR